MTYNQWFEKQITENKLDADYVGVLHRNKLLIEVGWDAREEEVSRLKQELETYIRIMSQLAERANQILEG